MSTKVFVIQPTIQPEAARVFAGHVELVEPLRGTDNDGKYTPDALGMITAALHETLPEIHGIFGYGQVTADMFERAPQLRCVMTPSSGAETIDLEAATAHAVPVINAAGAAYVPVAEHVIGLALSLLKLIALPDREVHATGHQRSNADLMRAGLVPSVMWRKTIGIVGYGFIGRSLAQKCLRGFDMDVIAYDPFFDPVEADMHGVRLVDNLDELLATSDIVSVNSPHTPETERLIDARALGLMKKSALLINCARGPIVDTQALADALRDGVIAGAGLDVTEPEPLPDSHPLLSMDNVVLTPHIGGVAKEFLPRMAEQTAREGLAVLNGRFAHHIVNKAVWPAYLERMRERGLAA
ncbi:NAD(P)-dependent oxidoreductase [Conexibacter stalactiti]|uniref:NAD(P)-dependent oxidoreductase n=1 Tax=Conexibacter stalactiti TaxID=1940611 RepID=A0ABU4HIA2_9ACTN|nr:NAD(P)-dependent oxidoreductase [Conexibacter stalactiti]MDW5593046.1 NAD(P)-dependent oxidoreductase [Conexibacter stalactiti]MEC5033687.1 NAD(P)-dependent oxidoreductase [Conexibacter stalactiti]